MGLNTRASALDKVYFFQQVDYEPIWDKSNLYMIAQSHSSLSYAGSRINERTSLKSRHKIIAPEAHNEFQDIQYRRFFSYLAMEEPHINPQGKPVISAFSTVDGVTTQAYDVHKLLAVIYDVGGVTCPPKMQEYMASIAPQSPSTPAPHIPTKSNQPLQNHLIR